MKKCAFILGFLILSGGCVFARCCSCYENYGCHYYKCLPPRLYRVKGHTHYIVNYPQTGISVNIGSGYPYNTRIINSYHGPKRNSFGATIHLSI